MNIVSAKFVKGIIGTDPILYDGKFQVAFLGRSNVGKSTLINSLSGQSSLARSSSNPGKTVRMDFFLINQKFYFVDLPGIGYARRSPEERDKLAKMIIWYLLDSGAHNRLIILVIDTKVGITDYDQEILESLAEHTIDHIIVCNKIDNLPIAMKNKHVAKITKAYPMLEIFQYSSKHKQGKNELLKKISAYLS